MDCHIIKSPEGTLKGLSIISDSKIGEAYFVKNLSVNHAKGKVQISIISDEISIANGDYGTCSLKIPPNEISPDELSLLKAYIESDETRIIIEHKGNFDLFAQIYFVNGSVREEGIKG